MSQDLLEQRITELESRLEFQDETISGLNDEMVVQQQRIFELSKTIKLLINQLQEKGLDSMDPGEEPPPPHY